MINIWRLLTTTPTIDLHRIILWRHNGYACRGQASWNLSAKVVRREMVNTNLFFTHPKYSRKIVNTSNVFLYFVSTACFDHYNDVIMSTMAYQITNLKIVYPTVYSITDQRKHQSSVSVVFVREIHRWRVNSPHKGPFTWKMFPCDDVIMIFKYVCQQCI